MSYQYIQLSGYFLNAAWDKLLLSRSCTQNTKYPRADLSDWITRSVERFVKQTLRSHPQCSSSVAGEEWNKKKHMSDFFFSPSSTDVHTHFCPHTMFENTSALQKVLSTFKDQLQKLTARKIKKEYQSFLKVDFQSQHPLRGRRASQTVTAMHPRHQSRIYAHSQTWNRQYSSLSSSSLDQSPSLL